MLNHKNGKSSLTMKCVKLGTMDYRERLSTNYTNEHE